MRGLPFLTCVLVLPVVASAEAPRALPQGVVPSDVRLQPLKDLDGYFPFVPSDNAQAWSQRAARRRRAMQVALGLWPMPTKTPANAVVHGRRQYADYTVEKVYLESFPGFYVTGNLYRPVGGQGRHPGVLCPHGHFADGRFGDTGLAAVRREIVNGAERFENGGRNQIQSRCVQLARMGCVVFNYDMIGYADSVQIPYELDHRFAKQRPEMNSSHDWGLFSPQAESHLQSILGMQCYNSIRALDWLLTLPDVDPERIGVTGASGGGTQTFLLSALDDRVTVAVPAVMVSTAMQGGCTCENACLLRISAGNVEFAALFAPRPLCLISANDWTREMPQKGFPELQRHYAMLGAEDRLEHAPLLHFGHNYNYVSRSVMYQFLNRHFRLALPEPVVEEDYDRLTAKELSVWDDDHPRPASGPDVERGILRWWAADSAQQIANLRPSDSASWQRFRAVIGGGVEAIIGRGLPDAGNIEFIETAKVDRHAYWEFVGLLRHQQAPADSEELPTLFLVPKDWNQRRVVIWLDAKGKEGLFADGSLRSEIGRLLDAGCCVVGVDLLYQGEFLGNGRPLTQTPRVNNEREAAAYTLGYNHSLFASRVHDIMTLATFVRQHERAPKEIALVALDGSGHWGAAAMSQAGGLIDQAAIDTRGFRFGGVTDILDVDFHPGGAKYSDLPGMLALCAPQKLWLAGEADSSIAIVRSAYHAANAARNLSLHDGQAADRVMAATSWLLAD